MNNKEIPEAYEIGWVPFVHTDIYLDSRPLIPRTETEYWTAEAIKEVASSGLMYPKVLDLCAGSGCIGVAVLKDLPVAKVDFVEIEEKHHDTIKKNLIKNQINPDRARVFGGDLFENVRGTYDFILSNPPYINPELKERVGESVKMFEPEIALYGGKDGLEIIRRIIMEAPKHLASGGVLYIEHEPEQVSHLSSQPSYKATYPDQYGVDRYSRFKF